MYLLNTKFSNQQINPNRYEAIFSVLNDFLLILVKSFDLSFCFLKQGELKRCKMSGNVFYALFKCIF